MQQEILPQKAPFTDILHFGWSFLEITGFGCDIIHVFGFSVKQEKVDGIGNLNKKQILHTPGTDFSNIFNGKVRSD